MTVLQNKPKKKGDSGKLFLAVLLFFFLFPYLLSSFHKEPKESFAEIEEAGKIWVLEKQIWGSRRILLEDYLVGMMAATIPVEFEAETLKAQAILLRSFCMTKTEKRDGLTVIPDEKIKEFYISSAQYKAVWKEETAAKEDKIKQALEDTERLVLLWQKEVTAPPFFYLGNTKSRDIGEYLIHTGEFGYLKTADCSGDILAKDYIEYMEMEEAEFEEVLASFLKNKDADMSKIILYRDSADYVKTVEVDGIEIDGEEFRYALGLPSACFAVEAVRDGIQIQVKGKGHGFGLSQFTANELAKEGKTYQELLDYFFTGLTFQKI